MQNVWIEPTQHGLIPHIGLRQSFVDDSHADAARSQGARRGHRVGFNACQGRAG